MKSAQDTIKESVNAGGKRLPNEEKHMLEMYAKCMQITVDDLMVATVYMRPRMEHFDWHNADTYSIIMEKIKRYGFVELVETQPIRHFDEWLTNQVVKPSKLKGVVKLMKEKDKKHED